jgi:hypothetical protein
VLDLAAMRWGIPVALALSERLGVDADLRPKWKDLLDHLAPFAVDTKSNTICPVDFTKPFRKTGNIESVALYAIYPFGVFGLGRPDLELARSTYLKRPFQPPGEFYLEPPGICNDGEFVGFGEGVLGLGSRGG